MCEIVPFSLSQEDSVRGIRSLSERILKMTNCPGVLLPQCLGRIWLFFSDRVEDFFFDDSVEVVWVI
jgi:hypothetical protein